MIAIAPVNCSRTFADVAVVLKRCEEDLEALWPGLDEIRDRSFESDSTNREGKAGRLVEDIAMLLEGSTVATIGLSNVRRHAAELGGSL